VRHRGKTSNQLARIDAEAAEWIVKRDRGLSAREQDAFHEWLAADPLHGERYARQGQSWLESNLLAQWRPEHSDEPNPDLLAAKQRGKRWLRRGGELSALAAAICLMAYLVWPGHESSWQDQENEVTRVVSESYAYQVLDDGSEIDLNDGAEVKIRYTSGKRLVELKSGEAFFTVAKDPERPFVVSVDGTEVKAVGTAFAVSRKAESVEVLVTEGRVLWESSSPADALLGAWSKPAPRFSQLVASGQKSLFCLTEEQPRGPKVKPVGHAEIERRLKWKPVLLDFDATPLSKAVEKFNQRNETQIVIADEKIADLSIVASLRSNQIDEFVRLLDLALGVKAKRAEDGKIALYAKN